MQTFMPALNLDTQTIAVIGEGEAAENKARLFMAASCRLIWFTLGRKADIPRDLASRAEVRKGPIAWGALKPARLVFIGVQDHGKAAHFARRARRSGALVNVVDKPELCDFTTPAIVNRGPVSVAISTGGAAPILARDVRSAVEQVLSPGLGLLAQTARDLRDVVKARLPQVDDRRRYWEKALRGVAAERAAEGNAPATRRALIEVLNRTEEPRTGIVHIVGAGPGDPELMTVRAARLIRDADVIVHDRLVSEGVLDRARRDAIRIDVGKTKGHHPVPQHQIEAIMIEHAQKGLRVVRLKGGDPFIFGRGGEELDACRAAGIEAYVTPGISAALACGAKAGVSLTHRDHAQAVTLVSGQPKAGGRDADYAALASENHTAVFYMGVGTADKIASRLIEAGRRPDTPVCVVEKGTLPDERVLYTTLEALGDFIHNAGVKGPAVLIVGEVAKAQADIRARETYTSTLAREVA